MLTFDDPALAREMLAAVHGNLSGISLHRLEARFRATVTQQIKVLHGLSQSIESSTGLGIPDLYCAVEGLDFWMELKMQDRILGSVVRFRFRANQREWLLKNMICGGRSLVGAHFFDGYAFARADVVACTGGAIPFGDPRYAGYVFTQPKLKIKDMLIWARYAFTLPLLTDTILARPVKVPRLLTKKSLLAERSLEDEGDPETGGN